MTNLAHDEPVFQISVVARMVGIHQQTIRAYERVGLLVPARSLGNTRLFSTSDVERLRQVVRLVNDLGINLAGVEVIFRLSQQIAELQAELAAARAERDEARAAGSG
ncbi:MAG: MerR family transcriptional regulator [Dehalococcoidia bacterium]|nr:MerR family transcriptional regulator [Dehalococcoidia bacterium]